MASTFSVLAEPTRRGILDLLREQPLSVGELVARTGLTQPGTSKHLRVLREAGLVNVRRQAQRRMFEVAARAPGRGGRLVGALPKALGGRFDALEHHLDIMADAAPDPGARPPKGANNR